MSLKICPVCNGSGTHRYFGSKRYEPCYRCGGSGAMDEMELNNCELDDVFTSGFKPWLNTNGMSIIDTLDLDSRLPDIQSLVGY